VQWSTLFTGIPPDDSGQFHSFCAFCREHEAHILATLPWLAAEIAGSVGFAPMLSFIRRFSGSRLHLSNDLEHFQERTHLEISSATHRKILKCAGETSLVDVPSAWGVFLALRRVAILEAVNAGSERRAIAQQFGVSERSLRKLTAS
jgi:hypothetical protein